MSADSELIALAKLGQAMRRKQSAYFNAGRKPQDLIDSKALERDFDRACVEVLAPPDLFGKGAR